MRGGDMSDNSSSDPQANSHSIPHTPISGGVNLDAGGDVSIGGDVVGRDKITTIGYTIEQVTTLLTQISSTFQPKPFDRRCLIWALMLSPRRDLCSISVSITEGVSSSLRMNIS